MAKVAGFLSGLTVKDNGGTVRDIKNDTTDMSLNTSTGQLDITGLDKTAMERMNLRNDVTVSMNGIVNNASNMQHDVFKTTQVAGAVAREIVMTTVAGPVFTVTVLFGNYTVTPGADGSLKWSASGALSNGTAGAWT